MLFRGGWLRASWCQAPIDPIATFAKLIVSAKLAKPNKGPGTKKQSAWHQTRVPIWCQARSFWPKGGGFGPGNESTKCLAPKLKCLAPNLGLDASKLGAFVSLGFFMKVGVLAKGRWDAGAIGNGLQWECWLSQNAESNRRCSPFRTNKSPDDAQIRARLAAENLNSSGYLLASNQEIQPKFSLPSERCSYRASLRCLEI